MADVHAWADQLRQYATHFVVEDWCYTRSHDIRHIRYADDGRGYDRIDRRWKRGLRNLLGPKSGIYKTLGIRMGPRERWCGFKAEARKQAHLPDGILDGGNVMVHWEETGEYLQYVQPSVGALLADLMDAHPELPEVQAIATEMKRINDDYARRIEKEVSSDG